MSTLEKTISMIKTLPETDLIQIQDFIQNIFKQRERESTDDTVSKILTPMSKKDFLRDFETAENEISDGMFKESEGVFDELEKSPCRL